LKIKLIIRGQEKEVGVPTSFKNLSYDKFLKLKRKQLDNIGLLSLILDLSKEEVVNISDKSSDTIDSVFDTLLFIIDYKPLNKGSVPNKIKIKSNFYNVPSKLELCTWWQRVELKELLKKCETDLNILELIPRVIAIYLYPIVTGETFDINKIDPLEQDIRETCNTYEAYKVGFFLLNSLKDEPTLGTKPFGLIKMIVLKMKAWISSRSSR